jgi:glycerophosphoryl diester phosphodiesterase
VNDRALADTLVAAGADGIITDDPRILAPFR